MVYLLSSLTKEEYDEEEIHWISQGRYPLDQSRKISTGSVKEDIHWFSQGRYPLDQSRKISTGSVKEDCQP